MFGPLERPRHRQERPATTHAPSKVPNSGRRDCADWRGPFWRLGHLIALTHHVSAESRKASGVALQKSHVVSILGDQDVGDCQHESNIGRRLDRQPAYAACRIPIIADRTYRQDVDPRLPQTLYILSEAVPTKPPGIDLCVLA